MKKMLVEGEMFMEKLHGGKDTSVAITKFAYISPTATPTRKTVYSLIFCFQFLLFTDVREKAMENLMRNLMEKRMQQYHQKTAKS